MPSNVSLTPAGTNHIENDFITGTDGFIIYQIEVPVCGFNNDFLRVVINSEYDLWEESVFQVFWANEGEGFTEDRSFIFMGNNGELLIPLGTSPSWMLSNTINRIRFDFPATMDGKAMPHIELTLYEYRDD